MMKNIIKNSLLVSGICMVSQVFAFAPHCPSVKLFQDTFVKESASSQKPYKYFYQSVITGNIYFDSDKLYKHLMKAKSLKLYKVVLQNLGSQGESAICYYHYGDGKRFLMSGLYVGMSAQWLNPSVKGATCRISQDAKDLCQFTTQG